MDRGDIISPITGAWAGYRMRVVQVRTICTRVKQDPVQVRQLMRCRVVDPAQQQTAAGAPNAGTLIDFYDNEVTLIATGESVP